MEQLMKIGATLALAVMAPSAAGQTVQVPMTSASIEIRKGESQASAEGSADHFTGRVRISMPFEARSPGRASGATVRFEPGARTAWHTHPLGQTLIVTAGVGLVQQEGGPVQEIRSGDVIMIPAGVKHWHGAATDHAMTHIAISERRDGRSVEWFEKVTDQEYRSSVAVTPSQAMSAGGSPAQPSLAQSLFGDVAPKLAQLTDEVLYADVWERPELTKRDRSLVTIAALIAMNRPDQLRSHIALARQNGLTQDEIVEAITHLAFYAGWPSAVSAATIAKSEFQKPMPSVAPSGGGVQR
jgi:4-carboxymuconolactone decarboxylase